MSEKRPFWKLLPPEPTPADDICRCSGNPPLKLMPALSSNPIHCIVCNLEAPLESLGLDDAISEEVANWNTLFSSIDHLELDSGEYEAWAQKELRDIKSAVNQRGLEVNKNLNRLRKSYFWLWQDQSADNWSAPSNCPNCGNGLIDFADAKLKSLVCDNCKIGVFGNGDA